MMITNTKEISVGGCTCPRCWLEPEQVKDGELYPLLYGPDLVLCPRCGLVPVKPLPADVPGKKVGRQARAAFHAETRRAKRKGNDPVGEAKELPRRPPASMRAEQGHAGFPQADPVSRPKAIDPMEGQVSPSITKEIDAWLIAFGAKSGGTPSDVVRAALSWAFEFAPKLRPDVITESQSRKRLNVRLTHPDLAQLVQLAHAHGLKPGQYTLLLLDELRRRSSLSKHLRFPDR